MPLWMSLGYQDNHSTSVQPAVLLNSYLIIWSNSFVLFVFCLLAEILVLAVDQQALAIDQLNTQVTEAHQKSDKPLSAALVM